jgi:hypothetical protein
MGQTLRRTAEAVMANKDSGGLKIVMAGGCGYINVNSGEAEALSRFLRSRGVTCSPPQPSSTGIDSIQVARGVDATFVQDLLNRWKGSSLCGEPGQ